MIFMYLKDPTKEANKQIIHIMPSNMRKSKSFNEFDNLSNDEVYEDDNTNNKYNF